MEISLTIEIFQQQPDQPDVVISELTFIPFFLAHSCQIEVTRPCFVTTRSLYSIRVKFNLPPGALLYIQMRFEFEKCMREEKKKKRDFLLPFIKWKGVQNDAIA